MTEPPAAQQIRVVWSPEARADLRAIAMQILRCVDRYLTDRAGDVKKLKLPLTGFRLRCGDYRVFFDQRDERANQVCRSSQPAGCLPVSLEIYPNKLTIV